MIRILLMLEKHISMLFFLLSQCVTHRCTNIAFLGKLFTKWCHPSAQTLGSSRLLPVNNFLFFVKMQFKKKILDPSIKYWDDILCLLDPSVTHWDDNVGDTSKSSNQLAFAAAGET